MAKYIVDLPHTQEECLKNLDKLQSRGADYLSKFEFGCNSGTHEGWATLEGSSDTEIRNTLPSVTRNKARIVKVETMTPSQIKSLHSMR